MLALAAAPAPAADLGAYLRARVAEGDAAAADAYAAALAAAPDDPVIAIRAFREALVAGDEALADRAAAVLVRADVAPPEAYLLRFAAAARAQDIAAAQAALAALAPTRLGVVAPSLAAWTALAARENPFAPLARATEPVARRFAAETRALVLIATGHEADGIAAVRALAGPGGTDLRIGAAQLLARRGEKREARRLLAGDDPLLRALADDLGRGTKPSLAFGATQLLTRLAGDLATGDPSPLAVALARAALRADPANDRARLLLAGLLARDGDNSPALALLNGVERRGPYQAASDGLRVAILAGVDEAAALPLARDLARERDATAGDWQRYADLLMGEDRAGEAAEWYRRVVEADSASWTGWLRLGSALDAAGRWPAAREALARAVTAAPREPLALNQLGYTLLVHGEDPAEARRLLERAHALDPDDASVADSLGWAYYRGGDLARALPLVEQAAAAEPTNPEIGEHLGDLYWHDGRRFEARYAWRAAAQTAEPPTVARLGLKILGARR